MSPTGDEGAVPRFYETTAGKATTGESASAPMAIFHCAVSHGSRKTGQSGAAKVDYIMRCGKYSRDPGELLGACAGHLPSWAGGNPRVFFEAVDKYERLNGRLFTQVIFAIPNELSDEDALLLAYHYADAVTSNGAPYALAVHRGGVDVPEVDSEVAALEVDSAAGAPEEADEADLPPHNRHGHLVICERIDDGIERTAKEWFRRANKKEPGLGGAAKDREMNGGNWVPGVRHLCAKYINYGLERAGFSERVTCESHETRIARAEAAGDEETAERLRLNPPGIHLGPTAWAIEKGRKGRKGRPSWRGVLNQAIAAEAEKLRGKVEELNTQLGQLDVQEGVVAERLEAARRVAAMQFARREEGLLRTSKGEDLLRVARVEVVGETAAALSVVQRGEVVELAEEKFGAMLDRLEGEVVETSVGPRYLAEAACSIVGVEEPPTLYQRETIVTTAVDRLGRELDGREASLQASAGGREVLRSVQEEHAAEYGPLATLAQCELQIGAAEDLLRKRREEESRREHAAAAERQEAERRQAEARRRDAVAGLEATLHATKRGAEWLAGAARQVLSGASRELTLGEREQIAQTVAGWVRGDLDRDKETLAASEAGARFLREAQSQRAVGAPPATLAEEEQQVGAVKQRLQEFEAAALARRAAEAARQREKEEKREREVQARRRARIEALSPAGRELHAAWLASLSPVGRRGGGPSGADVDRMLEATASDPRLPRLETVFEDAEQRSYYRAVLGAAGDAVTLQQVDAALEATGTFVRQKQDIFAYSGNSEHLAGGALYAAAIESQAPGWRPGADVGTAAVFDDALADVKSQLAKRVRQAADEFEKLLPTTPSRNRRGYRVPALSDALVDQLSASRGDAFVRATVAEVRERYAHRARHGARDEDRYSPKERLESERAHLADVIAMTWDREKRLWYASNMSGSRPSRRSVLARVLKKYLTKVWEFFQVACDKVLGGDLGERLRRRREHVEQAAEVAERLLPTTQSFRRGLPVPAAYEEALAGVVTDGKNRKVIEEMVEAVWERFHRRSRHEPYEQRYDADDRRRSEEAYLAPALEITRARQERAWRRSSLPSPRPTLASARPSVLEEHQSHLREVFEVAHDEVFGRGELGARWRRERDQVRRAVDAAEATLPATPPPSGHPDRHVPALSDDTLDDLDAAETDPFLKKMYSLAWERCYRHASADTPYEQRYDAEDRRQSELAHLTQTYDRQMDPSSSTVSPAPELASVRESVLKDYRAKVRGIFVAARDEVLRHDELQERQREQSVRPGRAATDPPSQSSSPGQERKPHGGEQEERGRQERTGEDSTTGRSGKDDQDERWRASVVPAAQPTAVTEANRVRLAAHRWAAKLSRTQPYAASSHHPSVITDERFNRLAAAAGDEFVRKVIAAVQKKESYYHDSARANSEREHLRPAVGRKHQEALDEYKRAEAKRGIFSRRPPKPTMAEAEAAAIKEFEAEQLGVIEDVCREVQQLTPAAVRFELQRVEPGRMNTPSPSRSRGRTTNQPDRGDSGPNR